MRFIIQILNIFEYYRNTYKFYVFLPLIFLAMFIFYILCTQALDLWSLGCTLYAFVFGKLPFYDESVLTLYNMIKTEPVQFPSQPEISKPLHDLLVSLLEKDPSSRITLPEIKVRIYRNHVFILSRYKSYYYKSRLKIKK